VRRILNYISEPAEPPPAYPLVRRFRYGWRGRTAIIWTLSGFVMLVLAYFGSKAVLELILQR